MCMACFFLYLVKYVIFMYYLQRPEDDVGCPETGVTSVGEASCGC